MELVDFLSIGSVQARKELWGRAVAFARHLEFETIDVMAVLDRGTDGPVFSKVDNVTVEARAQHEDPAKAQRCPVMQHCKRSHTPIVWDRDTYKKADQMGDWETQAQFGFRTGIAVASHMPHGRHLMIGVDRDKPLPQDAERVTWLMGQLQLFLAFAVDSAMEILLPAQFDEPFHLTRRELEALRWTIEGKTAWEVGRILNISEQTAARHLFNATHKLGCANKMQAVAKALRLRILT